MPEAQTTPPGFPPIRTEPVVVNVNTAKPGFLGGAFANRLLLNMLTSWISSWLAYAVAATGLIPYILAFGLWWFGWTAKAPIPPGKQPPPAAVDPRFDSIDPRFQAVEEQIRRLEQEIQEGRDRSAAKIGGLEAENARLAESIGRAEGEGRRALAVAARKEAEWSRFRDEYESHSRDCQ